MTPEVIASFIALGLSILGFALYCGRLVQRVDNTEQVQDNIKVDVEKVKDTITTAIEKQAREFNDTLKSHVAAETIRDGKVEVLKEELQKQIRDSVRHEAELRYTKEQTEELKKEVHYVKIEIESIKTSTNEIKQDVIRLATSLEQLVEVNKETNRMVQALLQQKQKGDN